MSGPRTESGPRSVITPVSTAARPSFRGATNDSSIAKMSPCRCPCRNPGWAIVITSPWNSSVRVPGGSGSKKYCSAVSSVAPTSGVAVAPIAPPKTKSGRDPILPCSLATAQPRPTSRSSPTQHGVADELRRSASRKSGSGLAVGQLEGSRRPGGRSCARSRSAGPAPTSCPCTGGRRR